MSDTSMQQHVLDDELQRMHCQLWLDVALTVCCCPNPQSQLAGEVKGSTIYIYDQDREHAIATLRHEVVDYASVSRYSRITSVINRIAS